MSAASRKRWHSPRKPAASMASSAATSTRPPSARSATSSISTTETGLKAARPLSKMPADIWRSFVGPLPPPQKPTTQPSAKRRLYPRRVRRPVSGGLMAAGKFPVPGQEHLKVLIVTDAWKPQVNGVVTTLELLGAELTAMGHVVCFVLSQGRFCLLLLFFFVFCFV